MSALAAAPEEVLSAVWPLARRCGVTRLAQLTHLDRVGIPVWYAIRPNSRSISLEGGKGVTDAVARVSATMESIERWHAEHADVPAFTATWRELADGGLAAPVDELPLARASLFHPDVEQRWVWAAALGGDGRLAVPAALADVHPRRSGRDLVTHQTGSNGLASGRTRAEAILGGLSEAIERDAVTWWRMRGDRDPSAYRRVDPATIPSATARELVARYDAAGVEVVLCDCRVDTAVPVYMAYLVDRTQRGVGLCRGYGAHLDPGRAMVQALCEAAQSRVSLIAGARDDRFASDLDHARRADSRRRAARFLALPATVDASAGRAAAVPAGPEAQIEELRARLAAAGVRRVGVLDLSGAGGGAEVAVVRVVAFGLEGYRTWYHRPGPRALRSMEEM